MNNFKTFFQILDLEGYEVRKVPGGFCLEHPSFSMDDIEDGVYKNFAQILERLDSCHQDQLYGPFLEDLCDRTCSGPEDLGRDMSAAELLQTARSILEYGAGVPDPLYHAAGLVCLALCPAPELKDPALCARAMLGQRSAGKGGCA